MIPPLLLFDNNMYKHNSLNCRPGEHGTMSADRIRKIIDYNSFGAERSGASSDICSLFGMVSFLNHKK